MQQGLRRLALTIYHYKALKVTALVHHAWRGKNVPGTIKSAERGRKPLSAHRPHLHDKGTGQQHNAVCKTSACLVRLALMSRPRNGNRRRIQESTDSSTSRIINLGGRPILQALMRAVVVIEVEVVR
jgi:hypothetical protein